MTSVTQPQTKSPVDQRTDESAGAARWLERMGRIGYVAKAIVYIIVGLLALRYSVWGDGWSNASSKGALETIFLQPLGTMQLVVLTAGLVAYAAWQLIAAFVDGEDDGSHPQGYFFRASKLLGFAGYGVLTFQAVRTLAGHYTGTRDELPKLIANVLAFSGGPWLVGLVGVGIFLFGLFQLYQVFAAGELRHLDFEPLTRPARHVVSILARFGFAARAVVFLIIGHYLVRSALEHDPREAEGMNSAFVTIGQRPYGALLLAAVAVGLVAYGMYQLVNAKYRRMDARRESGLGTR